MGFSKEDKETASCCWKKVMPDIGCLAVSNLVFLFQLTIAIE